MNNLSEADFQTFKAAAVALALLVSISMQHFSPYRVARAALVANWKVNFPLAALNTALTSWLCGGCACAVAKWAEQQHFGLTATLGIPSIFRVVISVAVLDSVAYFWHRANHRFQLLWRFHAVHHSDIFFDASTAVRFHPVELALSLPIRLGIVVLLGLPVAGILLFEVIYAFANLFEHGNISLDRKTEKLLNWLLVTPAFHRKHHSRNPRELNANYATIFSIWDRIFGSHLESTSQEAIAVGLPDREISSLGVLALLKLPIGILRDQK